MKELQKAMSTVRQAVQKYRMISDGDKIAVGISGGKDSVALLYILSEMRKFMPIQYELCAVTVDMGFPGFCDRLTQISEFIDSLGIEYRIEKTQIAQIVFDERREKNPCSLCAKLRRGALNNASQELGAGKIALGHHLDDAVETFMMSVMHEGRIGCFSPVTWYEDRELFVIRPLIYTPEKDIRALVKNAELPIAESMCPENGNTSRAEMKEFLHTFDKTYRGLYKRVLGSLERRKIDGWYD